VTWGIPELSAIEVVTTVQLGWIHTARGEFSDAAAFLGRNVALEGGLRYERIGASAIQSAFSRARLADVLSQFGRFDEAIGHAEAAVQTAEATDHPLTLYVGLIELGRAHLRRGDLPRATPVLGARRCGESDQASGLHMMLVGCSPSACSFTRG
jgi:Tetratricopeptide repeat